MPVSFGGTISGGIQDISALLPLLGTEQVAKHVGSALQRGYLYAAAAPLSIFGSLGQVQAAFAIGLASVPSYYGFGARLLKDAGFEPTGEATKMITLEPEGKYVCEIRFKSASDTLLSNRSHFFSTIHASNTSWNFYLVLFSSISAMLSFIPYLHFIIRHDTSRPLLAWLFPLIRALGALLCVVAGQLLLQNRIVTIYKQQIQFMRFDAHMKSGHLIPQTMRIFPYERNIWWNIWRKLQFWRKNAPAKAAIRWGDKATSEECLWDLYRYMKALPSNDSTLVELSRCIGGDGLDVGRSVEKLRQDFLPHAIFNVGCQLAIFFGLLASVVGYVGCFSILQDDKATATGRYLWIGLEAALSVLRMLVWALNPKYDDSTDLELSLERDTKSTTGPDFDRIPTSRLRRPSNDGTVTFDLIDSQEFVAKFIKTYGSFPPSKINDSSFALYYTKVRKSALSDVMEIHITILDLARNQAFLFSRGDANSEHSFSLCYATLNSREMTVSWHPINDVVPHVDGIWRNDPLLQELIIRCDILMKTINNANENVDAGVQIDWVGSPRVIQPLVAEVDKAWIPIKRALNNLMYSSAEHDPSVQDQDILSNYHAKIWSYFGYKEDSRAADFAEFAAATFRARVQEVFENYFEVTHKYQSRTSEVEILSVLAEYESGLRRVKNHCGSWGRSGSIFISQIKEFIDEWASIVWFNLLPPPSRNETLSDVLFHSATEQAVLFSQTGEGVALDNAISWFRKALMILPSSHHRRLTILISLATSLDQRGQGHDLDDAIHSCNLAHRLSPSALSTTLLESLAKALESRFNQRHQVSDLDQGIELLGKLFIALGHDVEFDIFKMLADMLMARFQGGSGQATDLDEVISLYKQALEGLPSADQNRPSTLNDVASALVIRFEEGGGQISDLDEATALYREVLMLCPSGHWEQSMFLNNLANTLRVRWKEGGGQASDLDEAISLQREALVLCPVGDPRRPEYLDTLAGVLRSVFEQGGGETSDLDDIIHGLRQVLGSNLLPSDRYRSLSLNNLADMLDLRFQRGSGQASDLDEAFLSATQSFELRPTGHPERSSSLDCLASVLYSRFQSDHDPDDLDKSIEFGREALQLRASGHPKRSESLINLARSLETCFKERGREATYLDEAITLTREALQLQSPGHPRRSATCDSLARMLRTRYGERRQRSDLNEAVSLETDQA